MEMNLFKRTHRGRRIGVLSGFMAAVCLGFLCLPPVTQAQQDVPPEILAYPDMMLYNGKVLTVDDSFTIVEAVAVRDGKFLATGTNERIRAMLGPQTRQVDLNGKTMTPGFIDTHFHIHSYAARGLRPSIAFPTAEQGLARLKELVEDSAPGEWIIANAGMVSAQNVPLTVKELDAVAPNNPVYISTSPGDALVNGYTLRLAKLPLDTFGLEKDPETGQPTGRVSQKAYGTIVYEVLPHRPPEELVPLYKAAMRQYNTGGMTTVFSRLPGEAVSAFKKIWEEGELTMRIRLSHEFSRNARNVEGLIKRVGNLNGFGDEWMKIAAASVGNPDGSLANGRGWTRKPKLGSGDDYGFAIYYADHDRSDWNTIVLLNRYDWSVRGIHTAGDRSIDELFSAFEAANREKSIAGRGFAFDHVLMVRPEHIEIAQRLGIMASAAPKYIAKSADRLSKLYGADEVYTM